MKVVVLIFALVSVSMIYSQNIKKSDILESFENKPTKDVFKSWHFAFKKPYDLNSEEGLKRYKVFKQNIKFIKKINAEQSQYQLGLGPFTDITYEEFSGQREELNEKKEINHIEMTDYFLDSEEPEWNKNLPNWNSNFNIQTARKYSPYASFRCFVDQFLMGMKEVFHVHIKNKGLPFKELSIQSMLDCGVKRNRCLQVPHPSIFRSYLAKAGWHSKDAYPELGKAEDDQQCKDIDYQYTSDITYCDTVTSTCTIKMKAEIMKQGPAISRIEMGDELQHYKSGIYDSKKCQGGSENAVLIHIGETFDIGALAFGPDWGEKGFIRVSREYSLKNFSKQIFHSCGLETYMAMPINLKNLD